MNFEIYFRKQKIYTLKWFVFISYKKSTFLSIVLMGSLLLHVCSCAPPPVCAMFENKARFDLHTTMSKRVHNFKSGLKISK